MQDRGDFGGQPVADKAELRCLDILRTQPDHFDSLLTLGELALRKSEAESAVAILHRALAIDATSAWGF